MAMVRSGFLFLSSLLIHLVLSSQPSVDFINGSIAIQIDPEKKFIKGTVDYSFEVLNRTDSVKIDAKKMDIGEILINRRTAEYRYDGEQITIFRKLKEGKQYELSINYSTSPEKAVYFIGWGDDLADNNQVWTQGQGKYSSHWVPSFDSMEEKVVFDLEITFDESYEIAANGRLIGTEIKDSLKTWKYSMNRPMSSYLLAFAAGLYDKDTLSSSSGIPIILYSYPHAPDRKEPTFRYTADIMDLLEKEIGVAYPWQNYKQIPVRDFLYAGMENTGATIFSDGFYIDSIAFADKNYVNVNAHEMAHQWFGNLVTEESASEHWLHEGFATYYALQAEKEIFGDEYYYWKLFDTAEALKINEGESLKDPDASSLTFYEKGAWALVALRELVGDQVFKKSIQNFLETYQYKNVKVSDFLQIVQKEAGMELKDYESKWLNDTDFPYEDARQYLETYTPSIKSWYELRWDLTTSEEDNEAIIKRYWSRVDSEEFKSQVLKKFMKSLSVEFIKEIVASEDPEIRRDVAVYLERVPSELKPEFESLLADPSYITRENALFKLWIYFPDDRARYLADTRGIYGMPNYNMRILWLFLAVLTNDFNTEDARRKYREELFSYTSERFSFEIRQNAFALITEVFDLPEQNLKDLVNASLHHSWQFRKYARNLLKDIMKDEQQRARLRSITKELNEEEQRYLNKELETK